MYVFSSPLTPTYCPAKQSKFNLHLENCRISKYQPSIKKNEMFFVSLLKLFDFDLGCFNSKGTICMLKRRRDQIFSHEQRTGSNNFAWVGFIYYWSLIFRLWLKGEMESAPAKWCTSKWFNPLFTNLEFNVSIIFFFQSQVVSHFSYSTSSPAWTR